MAKPKWVTPDRQTFLAKLTLDYIPKSGWQIDIATGEVYHPELDRRINALVKDWALADRARRQAEWQAERRQIHSLGERRYPVKGQFNAIAKDIFYGEQPEFYIEGLGVSGLTFKPFAMVRLASSPIRLFIDLGDSLKGISKARKRKAVRYGKPLPSDVEQAIQDKIALAVRQYLNS
jgi:hypothetical protein